MEKPEEVWVIQTKLSDHLLHYYAAVDTEEEARDLTAVKAVGEPILDMRRVRNVDRLSAGEWREIKPGPTSSPLIP